MAFLRLFKALAALALLFGAVLTAPAAAAAPAMPGHHAIEMSAGHCAAMPGSGPAAPSNHESDQSCCAASCIGAAVASSAATETVDPVAEQPALGTVKSFLGVLAEIATPPPRRA